MNKSYKKYHVVPINKPKKYFVELINKPKKYSELKNIVLSCIIKIIIHKIIIKLKK